MTDERKPDELPGDGRSLGMQPTVPLPAVAATETSPVGPDTLTPAVPGDWHLPGGRYHVVGEIAHGGMGVVLRVIDLDVQRPLAVKVLLRDYDRTAVGRFIEEARITGQLQHPGIPPVHEIGRLEDGRPFFSMKLIEGHTLSDLLRERATPQVDLPRFLKIFEQIAQTLAFAHSRGIIHRDLKPLNVMVGAFGEVQVMDWGLAHRIGAEEHKPTAVEGVAEQRPQGESNADTDASALPTLLPSAVAETLPAVAWHDTRSGGHSDSDRLTQDGQVLGTPAYMPPEQARGQVAVLDQRCDVFGLGAILCVILTGKPPYHGFDRPTTLRHAQQGDLADAYQRLADSGAHAELVALCRECLSAEPATRPAHAGEVARRITLHLASVQERLREAEIAHAASQARAEQERRVRRRNRVIAGVVVSVLALLGGIGFWVRQQQTVRVAGITAALDEAQRLQQDLHARLSDERTAAQLQSELQEWERLLAAAQGAWKRADALAAGSRGLLARDMRDRLDALGAQLQADEQDRQLVVALDSIRLEAADLSDGQIKPALAAPKVSAALAAAGYSIESGDQDSAQLAERIRRSAIRVPLVAGLDFWAGSTRDMSLRARVLDIARRADPHPWRDRLRQPERWKDKEYLETLAAEVDFAQQSPQLLTALALRLVDARGDAAGLLRRALVHHPRDFWLFFQLGHTSKNAVEQIGAFRAALAIRPESPYVYYGLGVVNYSEKKLAEAEAYYRRALQLDSEYVSAHINLTLTLGDQGKRDEAIASGRRAVEIDPNHALAHVSLGTALQAQEKFEEAEVHYRRALEIDPKSLAPYNNLGTVLRTQGKLAEAAAVLRQAVKIGPQFAMAWCNLGHTLRQLGQLEEALACFRRGHDLGTKAGNWTFPSAEWIADTERQIVLDRQLPDFLSGQRKAADADESQRVADLCLVRKRYVAMVRFSAEAFAGNPKLADDPTTGVRYNAACAAALAVAGQGQDAAQLSDDQRRELRRRALEWLRADLAGWSERWKKDRGLAKPVAATLNHWIADPDLAAIRAEQALSGLEASERSAWLAMWREVQSLRDATQAKE